VVATSFSLLTTDQINLCTQWYRKCHKPEPVGIFYTVLVRKFIRSVASSEKRSGNYCYYL